MPPATTVLATTEDVRTWWASDGPGRGEWLEIDLREAKDVRAVQVNLADHGLTEVAPELVEGHDQGHTWRGIYNSHDAAEYTVEASADGNDWVMLQDGRGRGAGPHALIEVSDRDPLRFVRLRAYRLPFDGPLAVSGIRVFGVGAEDAPGVASARYHRPDPRTAEVEWSPADRAQSYVVRYGTRPERLYRSRAVLDGRASSSAD